MLKHGVTLMLSTGRTQVVGMVICVIKVIGYWGWGIGTGGKQFTQSSRRKPQRTQVVGTVICVIKVIGYWGWGIGTGGKQFTQSSRRKPQRTQIV